MSRMDVDLLDRPDTLLEGPADVRRLGLTHRIGVVLAGRQCRKQTPAVEPDEDTKWLQAARAWARGGAYTLGAAGTAASAPADEAGWDDLILGVTRARRAASLIMDKHGTYDDAVRTALTTTAGVDVKFGAEEPSLRFAPGGVIDFPEFVVSRNGEELASCRLCLTVCLHENHSKIWGRFYCDRRRYDSVGDFVDQCRAWFVPIREATVRLYGTHLENVLDHSGEPATVAFTDLHKIEFVSADTDSPGLGDLAAAIAVKGELYTEETRKVAEETEAFVKSVTDLGIPPDTSSSLGAVMCQDTDAFQSGTYYLVSHRTVRGSCGVYVARAHGSDLVFAGLASNEAEPLVRIRKADGRAASDPGSPSVNVTAELANTVARHF